MSMTQKMDLPKHRFRRVGKPKSRTGCMACRRRRIKCDEARPTCYQCSRSRYQCDFPQPIPAPRARSIAILLPKMAVTPPSSGRLPIEVEAEFRYFDLFQRKTVTGFHGILDWSVWTHVVLQLCHHEPFVRESVVAIGALIRSLEASNAARDLLPSHGGPSTMAIMHKQFALLKYGRAVKAMQALVDPGPRQRLVACLLVFCFETLLNNRSAALPIITTGHCMLQRWLLQHHRSALISSALRSPVPTAVDDELVDAFEHVDLQLMTIYDVRPIDVHRKILSYGRGDIDQMPSVFNTLTAAGKFLILVMKQTHHFLATTWEPTQCGALVADFVAEPPGSLLVVSGINTYGTPYIVPNSLREEQKPYAEYGLRWSRAFEPLFRQVQQVERIGSENYVTSATLRVQSIAARIMVAGVLFTEELSYDVFLPHFQEMLTLINIIVDAYGNTSDSKTAGAGGFVLGLGISMPLFTIVTRCRDRSIRRRIIEILSGWHHEACWDPLLNAEIGKFIMDVEEDGSSEGVIPESSRAVLTRVSEAPPNGGGMQKALIQLVQRHGGPGGGPVWKEKMVYWWLP